LTDKISHSAVGTNDWVDDRLLAALAADSVHLLISEDGGVLSKARSLGLADRVLTLSEAIDLLGKRPTTPPPAVRAVVAHDLDPNDPVFGSFRQDYPDFDEWLRRCRLSHRKAWRIDTPGGAIAAFCIIKDEDDQSLSLGERPTKICSFKVSEEFNGHKYGELLLKAVFEYCHGLKRTGLYVTAFPRHAGLITLLLDFGFVARVTDTTLGEKWLGKQLVPSPSEPSRGLDYHLRFGPPRFDGNMPWHIVPIRPEFSNVLFPESARTRSLFEGQHPFGNAIRKAYLCNSPSRMVQPGHVLAFYRTGEEQSLIALGIVEDALVSSDVASIATAVARRTVYSLAEIQELCRKPVLALLFRQTVVVRPPRTCAELIESRIFKRALQSIMSVKPRGLDWLRQQFLP
jgi:GNAT superfamily N-acetyltransferase